MDFLEINKSVQTFETIENYARSDDIGNLNYEYTQETHGVERIVTDEDFWCEILRSENGGSWGIKFDLYHFALCEWIPRIPGLYWKNGSRELRKLGQHSIEFLSDDFLAFTPLGKSQIVHGGIGTLKLPPVNDFHLVSLSAGNNASSGIPTLMSPDVWEHYKLRTGDVLNLQAKWEKMEVGWAERFHSIRGIPRGYLVVLKESPIEVVYRDTPVEFHPFTVMEYSIGSSKLFDFVYATADSHVKNYRYKLENFFDEYKNRNARFGKYLLSADINEPMWEAEYDSPATLRRTNPAGRAQLELLEARIRGDIFNKKSIEIILQEITSFVDVDSLVRISTQLNIPQSHWYSPGLPLADLAAIFLDISCKRDKVEEFLEIFGDECSHKV